MAKNYLLIYSEQLATDIELLCQNIQRSEYLPALSKEEHNQRYAGWKNAVNQTLNHP